MMKKKISQNKSFKVYEYITGISVLWVRQTNIGYPLICNKLNLYQMTYKLRKQCVQMMVDLNLVWLVLQCF